MTDEQIIKAMQCVIGNGVDCTECEYQEALPFPSCMRMCAENALNLINRQKTELSVLCKIINKQDEEISELSRKVASRENLEESFLKTTKEFSKKLEKTVKAECREAIKEFAKQLKGYTIGENGSKEKAYFFVEVQDIDNLVKEMTENK